MDDNLFLRHLNLLFIDDNTSITADAYALFYPLFKSVILAHDSDSALSAFKMNKIDIIITDIELPGEDGLNIIEKIREKSADLPIIILTSFIENDYLLRAANLRLDGYLIKPLNFKKFSSVLLRITNRLESKSSIFPITDHVSYNFALQSLMVDQVVVSLGKKEHLLLKLLLSNKFQVVSKAQIERSIWPDQDMSDSALKSLMSELRKKLKYKLVVNVPARGWVIDRRRGVR